MSIDRLSENVLSVEPGTLTVSKEEARKADTTLILDGEQWDYWRGGQFGHSATYIRGRPSDLSNDDMVAINRECDGKEGSRNRRVKKDIAHALSHHFKGQAYHISEFGPGMRPIIKHLEPGENVSYLGIECDSKCVTELHKMDIPAADWEAAMHASLPEDRPRVTTAIYAMHFMVNDQFAENIKRFSEGDGGLFIGNFYLYPRERETGEERQRLKDILNRHNMTWAVMTDPHTAGNEYWIISKSQDPAYAQQMARDMQEAVENYRGRHLEISPL